MNTAISFALDFIVVLLIAVPIILGTVRGLKRRIFSLLALAISTAAAFAVSGIAAQPIYESLFKEKVYAVCLNAAEEYDPVAKASELLGGYGINATDEEIRSALTSAEGLPQSMGTLAQNYGADSTQAAALEDEIRSMVSDDIPDEIQSMLPEGLDFAAELNFTEGEIYDAARACAQSPEEAADYAESVYAAPIITALIKTAVFALTQIVMGLIMRLAFLIFGIDFRRPLTATDRLGGFALGVVTAAANVLIMAIVVNSVEQACGDFFVIENLNSVVFLPIFNFLY
jgi:uncharacterized membrane protein required for colicin V production